MFDASKTRMIGLPYGEKKTVTICYAIFIWYRNVTDRQTNRRADRRTDLLYQYRAPVCWCASAIKIFEFGLPGACLLGALAFEFKASTESHDVGHGNVLLDCHTCVTTASARQYEEECDRNCRACIYMVPRWVAVMPLSLSPSNQSPLSIIQH